MESRRRWLLLLGCCLIPILNFPRALFADRSLFARDVSTVWSPQIEAVVRQIADGEPPFFDARRGFGQPLFADPRAEVLYPPAWIHWIVPPGRSYAWFCALHLIVAAWGAARLVRRSMPEANLAAPLTAAMAFGASGPLLSLVSHWHHLAAVAWMPWIIDSCDPKAGEKTPWLSLPALVTLQTLAGSPDYSFATVFLCGLRLATRSDLDGRAALKVGAAFLLGILIASVQVLPSLGFAAEADRSRFPVGWALSSLHPILTLETLLPVRAEAWPLTPEAGETLLGGMQVWMFSHYLGLSVWILACLGFRHAPKEERRFAMAAIVMGVVFSWGVEHPSLQGLVARIPLVSGLRFPTKYLAATSLGLALLASRATQAPSFGAGKLWAGIGAALGVFLALHGWATGMATVPHATLIPLVLPLSLAAALSKAQVRTMAGAALIPLFVGADLLATLRHLNPTTPASLFRDRPPLSAYLPPGSRLYVSDYSISVPEGQIRPPQGIPYRLGQIPTDLTVGESVVLAATWYLNPPIASRFGYLGSFDLDILDFYRAPLKKQVHRFVTSRDPELVLDQLRRASVDFVVTMDPPDLWKSLPLVTEERRFFEDTVRVFKVPDPWPRVRYETKDGHAAPLGVPVVSEMRDGRIVVQANPKEATRLVVAVANDRGWRARVNGRPKEVFDNDLAFVSVEVDAGPQTVEIDYRPPYLGIGALLSLIGLATTLALALRARRDVASRQV